jgi:hypothetical protein
MTKNLLAAVVLFVATLAVAPGGAQVQPPTSAAPATSAAADARFLDQYCETCHNTRTRAGGLALDDLDVAKVEGHAETWEKVVRKLRTGTMPPANATKPTAAVRDTFTAALEARLDAAATRRVDPGTPALHRLNRTEYGNAIRDLLALDVDVSALLPPDDSTAGFDNIADVLGVSPALIEGYVAAATKISRLAMGDPSIGLDRTVYRVAGDVSQDAYVEGLPLGTRGGMVVRHAFPLDAEYDIQIGAGGGGRGGGAPAAGRGGGARGGGAPAAGARGVGAANGGRDDTPESGRDDSAPVAGALPGGAPGAGTLPGGAPGAGTLPGGAPGAGTLPGGAPGAGRGAGARGGAPAGARGGGDSTVYMALDGVRVPAGRGSTRIRIPAGPHTIAVASLATNPTAGADGIFKVETRAAGITQISISGPHNPTGPGDTPSRRRLLVCTPASAADEEPCARRIFSTLLTRAYRRPVGTTAPELATPLEFYRAGRESGSFEAGIRRGLARVLVDPAFLFRFEREPAGVAAGAAFRLSDLELASRLSFFLWSSVPDDELIALASKRGLQEPQALEQQVRRMLADPRAEALVSNFAGQWLFLRELKNARPESRDFDGNLRASMQRETELLFRAVLQEDRSVIDFLDADFTFVDERLARHYGLPDIRGERMRRVTLPAASPRRGLLGHASVLTLTSAANRTSPVVRGKWVLENLLGTPPPQPPPGVETNLEKDPQQVKATSLRQRLEQHRANAACASCHRLIDPVGLALENFDHTGKWREKDGGVAIDASGQLADGTRVNGPDSLRRALLARSDVFVTVLAEKLMTYAVGRPMRAEDMPAVRAVVRGSAPGRYRFSSMILEVVKTPQFQMRTKSKAGSRVAVNDTRAGFHQ